MIEHGPLGVHIVDAALVDLERSGAVVLVEGRLQFGHDCHLLDEQVNPE